MPTDIISQILDNPIAIAGIVIIAAVAFYAYKNKPKKEEPRGREFLIKEVQYNQRETMKVLGQPMGNAEVWQGMNYIGTIKKFAEQPAQLIDEDSKDIPLDKIRKVYNFQLYKDYKLMGIPFGKIMANLFDLGVFILVADSDSFEKSRVEDTEIFRRLLSQTGFKPKIGYEVFRLKPDVFLETHVGITIAHSQIVQDYMRSINWKILHEEAQGEYLLTPRRFAYFAKDVASKVEVYDAASGIDQKAQEAKKNRYTG